MDKHTLGDPGKGFHATRIMGFALYDILGTIVIAFAFSYFTGFSFWYSLLGLLVLAELLHWYFGVETAFLKLFNRE